MVIVSEKTASIAWEQGFVQLFDNGIEMPENGFSRHSTAVIEIKDVENNLYNELFPMPIDQVNECSNYLLTGEGIIDHDWSRIYRERIFESDGDKTETIVKLLTDWPDCPRAQIGIWDNQEDIKRDNKAPCLQLLWFKIIEKRLELHVHMRTCDCYGKLLMNINEFISLQKMVSKKLNLESGAYIHFIDSLHFHKNDEEKVVDVYKKIKT